MRRLPLIILLLAGWAHAQITANSCSASDVQSAFNSVTNSTTTVTIPACSAGSGTGAWTTQVTLTIPSGNTSLTVQGSTTSNISCNSSGSCTGGTTDGTVIIDNYASNSSLLIITTNSTASSYFRLTGITIQGGSGLVKYQGFITMHGSSQNFRFDHNHINTTTYGSGQATSAMQIQGCVYGVADHNQIDNPSGSVNNGIQTYQGACNSDAAGSGNGAWAQPGYLGTANSFYMEDNIFNSGAADDCLYGGRFVFRYNTFNMTAPPPTIQTHATGSATDARGCRSWELYNNTVNAVADNYLNALFFLDAGTGVIWGNTIPSSSAGGGTGYKNVVAADNDRTNNTDHTHTPCTSSTNCSNSFGFCGTSFNGTGSTWDQNSSTTTGYLCLDQPGAGQSDLLEGTFPTKCDETTGCSTYNGTWPNQASAPIYEWADAYSPVPDNQSDIWSTSYGPITQNQDYYLGTTNSGTPISFNGTAGVGAGTLVPTNSSAYSGAPNCTPKVAYWDSTSQTLYQCTATNTWTSFYTPYTYPHPLEGGTSPASTPTFSPVAGTYTGVQSVTISSSSDSCSSYIYWSTVHNPPTTSDTQGTSVSVGTSETVYAKVIGCPSYSDSSVGSAAYTINTVYTPPAPTALFAKVASNNTVSLVRLAEK